LDRHGQLIFEIKWKGYPASDNTWEPEEGMIGAQEAIRDYFDTIGGKREELRTRLQALDRRLSRDRRLTMTQVKWLLRDLVGRQNKYPMEDRVREALHKDIAQVSSFRKAHDLVERVLRNFEQLFKDSQELIGSKRAVKTNRVTDDGRRATPVSRSNESARSPKRKAGAQSTRG